jgi:hypothetical protein
VRKVNRFMPGICNINWSNVDKSGNFLSAVF